MKKLICLILLFVSVICLNSCDSEYKKINIIDDEINLDLHSGYNVKTQLFNVDRDKVHFYSSDETVASFTGDLLVAHKEGMCSIYAVGEGAVSDVADVNVYDFISIADDLKKSIGEYYGTGKETQVMTLRFSEKFRQLPKHAAERVDNFYIVEIYKQCKCEGERVYIGKNSGVYHSANCSMRPQNAMIILKVLAEYQGKRGCKNCQLGQ